MTKIIGGITAGILAIAIPLAAAGSIRTVGAGERGIVLTWGAFKRNKHKMRTSDPASHILASVFSR